MWIGANGGGSNSASPLDSSRSDHKEVVHTLALPAQERILFWTTHCAKAPSHADGHGSERSQRAQMQLGKFADHHSVQGGY